MSTFAHLQVTSSSSPSLVELLPTNIPDVSPAKFRTLAGVRSAFWVSTLVSHSKYFHDISAGSSQLFERLVRITVLFLPFVHFLCAHADIECTPGTGRMSVRRLDQPEFSSERTYRCSCRFLSALSANRPIRSVPG